MWGGWLGPGLGMGGAGKPWAGRSEAWGLSSPHNVTNLLSDPGQGWSLSGSVFSHVSGDSGSLGKAGNLWNQVPGCGEQSVTMGRNMLVSLRRGEQGREDVPGTWKQLGTLNGAAQEVLWWPCSCNMAEERPVQLGPQQRVTCRQGGVT